MLYYKLELTPDNKFIVQDIVEDKKDDNYIYATEKDMKRIKSKLIVDYNSDLLDTLGEDNPIRKKILKFIND